MWLAECLEKEQEKDSWCKNIPKNRPFGVFKITRPNNNSMLEKSINSVPHNVLNNDKCSKGKIRNGLPAQIPQRASDPQTMCLRSRNIYDSLQILPAEVFPW